MMMNIRALLVVFSAVVLAACSGGGDGSSSDGTPSFAGTYNMDLALTTNNCNAAVENTMLLKDTVSQDGRSITIGVDGDNFKGTVDADNGGFAASFTEVVDGATAVGTITFRTATPGSTYAATLGVTVGACTIVYSGTAKKV
jgi:hypothetical protein